MRGSSALGSPRTDSPGRQGLLRFIEAPTGPQRAGAKEAVLNLVREQPYQLLPSEIVKRLQETVESNAKNKAKMLFQTIANMKKRGQLVVDDRKRLAVGDT